MTLSFRERTTKLESRVKLGSTDDDNAIHHESDKKAWAIVDCLRFKDTHETLTDIAAFEVEKGAITFSRSSISTTRAARHRHDLRVHERLLWCSYGDLAV